MELSIDTENQMMHHIDELTQIVDKRIFLLINNPIVCPVCKSRDTHAQSPKFFPKWKCRHCGHEYTYEPVILEKEK